MILAALGVVYGDIGTSPLYALKQCFTDGAASVTEPRVFGVLSLITWALMVVVTLKYVLVVMRADNRGEGGILALTALALRGAASARWCRWILLFGLLGSALFYGDGVITPAISVLSAVEGLKVATPVFEPYIIPITLILLIALFAAQSRGTARVGGFFGPVMVVWFVSLGLLGFAQIVRNPIVLLALDPLYGLELLIAAPWEGFVLLGAVVLAVTGAEALYADMGHFGARPIRTAWLCFVFPALLLNYFGQGALLLANPGAVENPFYRLAPAWCLYPLVGLASVATIIASQAVISGAFSITHQAVQLGYLPRLRVLHTSEEERGQVYLPFINALLFLGVVAVVLGFRSSDALGAAYGIAVTGTMAITTSLAFLYMRRTAGWPPAAIAPLFTLFLLVDLVFFGANLLKIYEGGWFPLIVGALIYAIFAAWIVGRRRLEEMAAKERMPLETFLQSLRPERVTMVFGTAVYMARDEERAPSALLHNLKHNKVLHERNVLLKIETKDIPYVPEEERIEIRDLGRNFFMLMLRYGFMDEPNIPRALALCRVSGFYFNLMETSFFIGREKIVPKRVSTWPRIPRSLFVSMHRMALDATEFFRIPPNRVVELGGQIEI